MTSYQKYLLRRHYKTLFTDDIISKHNLEEEKIFSATSLAELDEAYSR
jgi:hypothetical protein